MRRGEDEIQRPNYLRAWREARRLTQAQLAAMIGTEGSVISLLESGDRGLSDKWLRKLAPPLGTTPGLLLDSHPDNVDDTVLEIFGQLPEPQKIALRTRIIADLPIPDQTEPRTEEPEGNVVKLHTPSRDQGKGRILKPNRKP